MTPIHQATTTARRTLRIPIALRGVRIVNTDQSIHIADLPIDLAVPVIDALPALILKALIAGHRAIAFVQALHAPIVHAVFIATIAIPKALRRLALQGLAAKVLALAIGVDHAILALKPVAAHPIGTIVIVYALPTQPSLFVAYVVAALVVADAASALTAAKLAKRIVGAIRMFPALHASVAGA